MINQLFSAATTSFRAGIGAGAKPEKRSALYNMKRLRAHKRKLILDGYDEVVVGHWLSHLRWLYNLALEQRELNYIQFRKPTSYYDQAAELPALKEVAPWLDEVPSQCVQQKLMDLDKAYKNFFKHGRGYPQFKKRNEIGSMRFPDPKQFRVDYKKGRRTSFVKLPKIGLVKFINSGEIRGKIKSATITKQADGFYISFLVEDKITVFKNTKPAVGIDRGVRTFGMTSDAECLELPIEKIKSLEKKLELSQKILSRKQKGSSNRAKQRQKVAKIHLKTSNLRRDSIHKITSQLAKSHGKVVMEDLKIKNMTASAAGTVEEPGRNVAQKSGLNRSILRQGWFEFERQLSYKLAWNGGELIKVRPHYTSQTCSACGHVEKENRNKEQFRCLKCGHVDHADINAAKNILALGHRVTVCSKPSRAQAQKPVVARAIRNHRPLGRGGCQQDETE